MALLIGNVTIDCAEAPSLAEFWTAAIGYEVTEASDDGAVLVDPERNRVSLYLQQVEAPTPGKNRVHLDLETDDVEREVERLSGLGARTLRAYRPPEGSWTVMADPEGNEFCVCPVDDERRDG